MAVASLRYRRENAVPEESKFGYVVFSGNPHEYHHWFFRSQLKLKTTKDEDKKKVVSGIVENLKGDALNVAMEIGIDKLLEDDGLDVLFKSMVAHIFPVARHESK
jgi:hypothetical protein